MSNFNAGWYLLYTRPCHEKKVYSQLSELNIQSFLPTKKRLTSRQGRRRFVDEPLFPSYVFIYLATIQHYYEGMDTDGGLYYVRIGKQLARVNESIVNNLKIVLSQRMEVDVLNDRIQPGQHLVVCQGPLCGLSCEVVRFNGFRKLLVRVELLQRSLLIHLPAEHLMVN